MPRSMPADFPHDEDCDGIVRRYEHLGRIVYLCSCALSRVLEEAS